MPTATPVIQYRQRTPRVARSASRRSNRVPPRAEAEQSGFSPNPPSSSLTACDLRQGRVDQRLKFREMILPARGAPRSESGQLCLAPQGPVPGVVEDRILPAPQVFRIEIFRNFSA